MQPQQLIANRYQVLGELGRGGMGVVYRVEDVLENRRMIALKSIKAPSTLTSEFKLRFKEEFRAMLKLRHPNTIEVYDYGQLDEQTQYLTMEIVTGVELTELVRGKHIPLDQAYPLLIQLLQTLGFIHSRLYVHRDIKSENIRVREDGVLKLMDFGLMDQLGIPSSGKITGTPAYMPPEVAKPGVINASSDLYSFGCLAYEILTGSLPFQGAMLDVIRAHIDAPPPRLRARRPDAPERLEAIVAKLMAKHQKDRYQDTEDVIADLATLAGTLRVKQNLAQKKSYLTSSALVARDAELGELMEALSSVRAGAGRAVFVGAPAGVGKSRLVQELLLQAKLEGVHVLHGQCVESGMASYEPLVKALRPMLALTTPEELREYGPVLVRIFSELEQQGFRPAPLADAGSEKIRLNEAIVRWLQVLSSRTPLVLFFDDLHWCDPSSLETFNHCARMLRSNAVFCLATFRSDEAPPGSPLWFTIEEGFTCHLRLTPFELPHAMQLLEAMLGEIRMSASFSEFLFRATAGNAFFLTEAVRYLMEEGILTQQERVWVFPAEVGAMTLPDTVEATILRRLQQLSANGLHVARVASVLGRYQSREALFDLSRLDEEALFSCLDELIERQMLLKHELGYTFPHDRVREALYADMSAAERQELHQRYAEHIEARHRDGLELVTNELAYHFSRGRDQVKAYEYLRKAGEQAKASGMAAIALECWKAAEETLARIDYPNKESHQVDLWFIIGSFGFDLWPEVAADALEKGLRVLEAQGNVDRTARMLKGLVGLVKKLPSPMRDRIIALLSKPMAYHHRPKRQLGRWLPPPPSWLPRIIESYGFLCTAYGFGGQPGKGLEAIERALDLLPLTDTPLEGALLVGACISLMSAGQFDAIVARVHRAVSLLEGRDLTGLTAAIVARPGARACENYRCFQGLRPNDDLLEPTLLGHQENHAYNLLNATWALYAIWDAWTGRPDAALENVELIAQNSRKIGAPPYVWSLYLRPYLLAQQGEYDQALALAAHGLCYPHMARDAFAQQMLVLLKGQIHLSLGQFEQARAEFAAAEQRGRSGGMAMVTIRAWLGFAELSLAEDRYDDAEHQVAQALGMCVDAPTRNPLHQAIAVRLRGEIAQRQRDPEAALRHFQEALSIVKRPEQDNWIEQGLLYEGMGDAYVSMGEVAVGLEWLDRAASMFARTQSRLRARQLAARIAELASPSLASNPEGADEPSVDHPEIPLEGKDLGSLMAELRLHCSLDGVMLLDSHRAETSGSFSEGVTSLSINQSFVEQALNSGATVLAIDLPEHFETGSLVSVEAPSVGIIPLGDATGSEGVLYCVRHDISNAISAEHLPAIQAYARAIRKLLARPE